MLKKLTISLLCILFLASYTTVAFAVTPVPRTPWQIELEDGLAFHMTPQGQEYEAAGYKRSGLYQGSELVYAVDIFIHQYQMFLSDDGLSFLVVRRNYSELMSPRGLNTLRTPSIDRITGTVSVYYRGILVDLYNLAASPLRHDQDNNKLRITTLDRRWVTFDLSTISVISERNIFAIVTAPLVVAFALIILYIAKKFKRPK